MASGISRLTENVGDAFLTLVIIGVAVTAVFGTVSDMDFLLGGDTWSDTLAGQLEGEVEDGFLAMAGLVILMVIIFVIRMVRARSE